MGSGGLLAYHGRRDIGAVLLALKAQRPTIRIHPVMGVDTLIDVRGGTFHVKRAVCNIYLLPVEMLLEPVMSRVHGVLGFQCVRTDCPVALGVVINRLTSPYSVIREEMLFEVLDSEVLVLDASLGGAISSLPETEQAIILLYYFAEWTDKRIAAELGCPRSTVQLKRTRALDMLRKYLEEEGVCCRDRDEL